MLDGLKILLAEDNPTNQMVAVQMLEALGASVSVAADGVEALEILAGRRFDLLLVDIEMPRKNGIDVIRTVRVPGGAHAEVPIIALTAYVMREHRQAIDAAGADGVIAKPIISIAEFGEEILALATRRRPAFGRRIAEDTPSAGRAATAEAAAGLAGALPGERDAEMAEAAAASRRADGGRAGGSGGASMARLAARERAGAGAAAQETGVPAGAAINRETLGGLAEAVGDVALAEILEKAQADLREAGETFSEGLATGDDAALRGALHIVTGLAGTLGADRLEAVARSVQTALHAGEASRVRALAPALYEELAAAITGLNDAHPG